MQKTNGIMDRAIPKHEINDAKNKKIKKYAIYIILFFILFFYLISFLQASVNRDDILTAIVKRGPITEMLNASGLVVPIYEENITSPIQSNIEKIYLSQGSAVDNSQTILQLNTNEVLNNLSQIKDEFDLKSNEKEKLNLSLEKSLIDLETRFSIKELQVESMSKKVEQERQLVKIGAGSKASFEIAELDLSIGKKEIEQLKRQIENQKKSLLVDLNEKNLELKILRNRIDEMQKQLELASIRPERKGIITWINENLGSQVQKGEVVAKVADLSAFRVQAKASDMIADQLYNGQDVLVDANQAQLKGKISNINPAIVSGTVTFYVTLEEQNNDILRFNLRVDVYVVTSFKAATLVIKNGPFFTKKRNLNIYKINGDEATRLSISIGLTNYEEVELIGDIKEGDEIILSNMEKYKHLEKIEVNH